MFRKWSEINPNQLRLTLRMYLLWNFVFSQSPTTSIFMAVHFGTSNIISQTRRVTWQMFSPFEKAQKAVLPAALFVGVSGGWILSLYNPCFHGGWAPNSGLGKVSQWPMKPSESAPPPPALSFSGPHSGSESSRVAGSLKTKWVDKSPDSGRESNRHSLLRETQVRGLRGCGYDIFWTVLKAVSYSLLMPLIRKASKTSLMFLATDWKELTL